MNFNDLIKRLLSRLGSSKQENAKHVPSDVQMLIQMVDVTMDVEFSCEDVYNILDQYTELVYRGDDYAELMPLVKHHIEICPDCREEFEALLRILEAAPA